MLGKSLNDFTQTDDDLNLSRKAKNVQNLEANPYKDIPSFFSISIPNIFQILKNPTYKLRTVTKTAQIRKQ